MENRVLILMGSESDWTVMKEAYDFLRKYEIGVKAEIASAHRTPEKTKALAEGARAAGIRLVIAGAGAAAHLPGVVAAYTDLPVIGVPIAATPLAGTDALYAIVQMPRGVPVATMAINGAANAGIFALEILAVDSGPEGEGMRKKLATYRTEMRDAALARKLPL